MTVTHFHDMHSGGTLKTDYHHIYVDAPEGDAIDFFESWFNRDPFAVACSCCGQNFSVTPNVAEHEESDLHRATAYERNCEWVSDDDYNGGGYYIEEAKTLSTGTTMTYQTLEEYLGNDDVAYFDREAVEKELGRVVND